MLDGSLLFKEHCTYWTKNTPKCPKHSQAKTFTSLVTTTVISRHSCKISIECFKFLNTLCNIPKISPKYCIMPPAQECKQWNISLYTDCKSNTKNICSEYDGEQLSKIDENTPKWASKYLKMPLSGREGATKSFLVM